MILSTYKIEDMEMKEVEKERKIKVLSLVALIVAVLGLTVAFAALSQTLTINGTASVNAAEWDIHFENLEPNLSDGAKLNSEPVLDGTSITGIDAVITKPGDGVEIGVDMVNKGTINAKIGSVEISKLCTLESPVESCDWNNDGVVTQEDIDKVNDNIFFTIMYQDATVLKVGDSLNVGETKHIYSYLVYAKLTENAGEYDTEEATELPKRNLKFDDLSIKINYVQAD